MTDDPQSQPQPQLLINSPRKISVWERMKLEHPEFTPAHDLFNDHEQVSTLLFDNYIGFTPFPGAKVMDIGANAGILTAYWALHGADVTAYEADPITYGLLTDMLARNNLRVNVINAAVWTHTGEVSYSGHAHHWDDRDGRNGSIQVPEHDGFTGSLGSEPDMVTVPCVSLPEAIGDDIWDAVKIDIEGAEFELLLSTEDRVIRDHIRYMHLEFHNGWASDDIYRRLMDKLEGIFDLDIFPNPHVGYAWHGRTDWARCTNKTLGRKRD